MSTYLLAFVISDFKNLTDGRFSVWAREEALESARYALEVGPKILSFFEDYFNISYPLPKIDMIALPDFGAGGNIITAKNIFKFYEYYRKILNISVLCVAMENWGLVTFREVTMLHDEKVSAPLNKQRVATIISHEIVSPEFYLFIYTIVQILLATRKIKTFLFSSFG